MARNRKRARDRRPRQPGTPVDPRQGLPTATHGADNGAAEHEHDNGAAELERGEDATGSTPSTCTPIRSGPTASSRSR